MTTHTNGLGLKVIGHEDWYGGGYCGICGDTEVVPRAVRFYAPDDGWKVGVLCSYCGEDAAARGPHPDDYSQRSDDLTAEQIDVMAEVLGDDLDCLI